MAPEAALRVALEPFWMSMDSVLPVQIGTHASDYPYAALLRSRATLSEEVSITEKLALPVKGHFSLIKCQDARNAHQYGIHFQASPVIRPFLNIQ
jgi:hypothetical protein